MDEPRASNLHAEENGRANEPAPASQSRSLSRGTLIALLCLGSLGLATLAAGLTYAGVVNNWAPAITGTVHSQSEYLAAVEASFKKGEATGHVAGYDAGVADGQEIGFAAGEEQGYAGGYEVGFEDGVADGSTEAFADGYETGYAEGDAEGFAAGYDAGHADGYGLGWSEGCLSLFTGLGTDRVSDFWDYYYSSDFASYYTSDACG